MTHYLFRENAETGTPRNYVSIRTQSGSDFDLLKTTGNVTVSIKTGGGVGISQAEPHTVRHVILKDRSEPLHG